MSVICTHGELDFYYYFQGTMSVTPDLEGLGDLPRIDYEVRAVKFTEYDENGLEVASCDVPAGSFVIKTVSVYSIPLWKSHDNKPPLNRLKRNKSSLKRGTVGSIFFMRYTKGLWLLYP